MKARDNPLRVERIERLIRFEPGWIGEDWAAIEARLDRLNGRGSVVGPHGSGKTTFLEALTARLEAQAPNARILLLRLAGQPDRRFSTDHLEKIRQASEQGAWILIDGAEQIGPLRWRSIDRLTRPARGLVINMHRRGRLPLLLRTHTTPEMLGDCLRRLYGSEELPVDTDTINHLWKTHKGNLRSAMREIYDRL